MPSHLIAITQKFSDPIDPAISRNLPPGKSVKRAPLLAIVAMVRRVTISPPLAARVYHRRGYGTDRQVRKPEAAVADRALRLGGARQPGSCGS